MSTNPYQQHIGGQWVDAANGGTWNVLNPATEEVVATVPFGTAEDCTRAIDAAHAAFDGWSRATAYERAAVLDKAAAGIRAGLDTLAHTTVLESGKPLVQARGEWSATADLLEWFAEEGKRAYGRVIPSRAPTKRMLVLKQPIGVVGLITAWNFPAWNIARAGGAALAAGCPIVVRPSEYTPMTGMNLVRMLVDAGAPPGVVNLVNGDPGPMGQAMLAHPALAKIHFTGSTRVGRLLMDGASKTVTRLSLELGGNAPVIVFPDVDLDQVVAGATAAKFRNGGQVCVSPQRFLVATDTAPAFADKVATAVGALRVGAGLDAATQVGPLINARQRDRVEALVAGARAAGANVAVGGRRPTDRDKGYFYLPTVVTDVAPEAALNREEIFGPVLPVSTFDGVDQAIALANQTRYGLAAYVWTNHLPTALRVAERLEFGLVGINEWTPHGPEAPFTGWKESGLGRESGSEGLDEYLETKLVAIGGLPR
jgi:acyl-CoA reductase-like NAD-dependent aldehyde dehydrogenase